MTLEWVGRLRILCDHIRRSRVATPRSTCQKVDVKEDYVIDLLCVAPLSVYPILQRYTQFSMPCLTFIYAFTSNGV